MAAGCMYFETCAPGVCMLFPTFKLDYIVGNTQLIGRVHHFLSLCTLKVHKKKPYFRTLHEKPLMITLAVVDYVI